MKTLFWIILIAIIKFIAVLQINDKRCNYEKSKEER